MADARDLSSKDVSNKGLKVIKKYHGSFTCFDHLFANVAVFSEAFLNVWKCQLGHWHIEFKLNQSNYIYTHLHKSNSKFCIYYVNLFLKDNTV